MIEITVKTLDSANHNFTLEAEVSSSQFLEPRVCEDAYFVIVMRNLGSSFVIRYYIYVGMFNR